MKKKTGRRTDWLDGAELGMSVVDSADAHSTNSPVVTEEGSIVAERYTR